mgnify:CR=1 FL=1|tara:strand:+ start:2080 stop:2499 length:420 start_codon:yes stop_codon:yes gene_type:complete
MPISINELRKGVNSLSENIDNDSSVSEFSYRSYCSKAYYTIYHTTKSFLNAQHNFDQVISNGAYSNMGTHKQLISFLDEHIHIPSFNHNREYRKLVYRLKTMRQHRVNADYYLDMDVDEVTYNQSKVQYEGSIEIIDSI